MEPIFENWWVKSNPLSHWSNIFLEMVDINSQLIVESTIWIHNKTAHDVHFYVPAATPFDPLLPAKGSTLRGGILTSFLVLLISTLIMWIASSDKNIPRYKNGSKKERKKIRETTTSWRHYTETLNLQKWYDMCCIICTQWKKVQPKNSTTPFAAFFDRIKVSAVHKIALSRHLVITVLWIYSSMF